MSHMDWLVPALAGIFVAVAYLWIGVRSRQRTWYARSTVTCPSDGRPAEVDVLSRPDGLGYLVSNSGRMRADVCACSRHEESPPVCGQGCLTGPTG